MILNLVYSMVLTDMTIQLLNVFEVLLLEHHQLILFQLLIFLINQPDLKVNYDCLSYFLHQSLFDDYLGYQIVVYAPGFD